MNGSTLDLSGAWSAFWRGISSGLGNLPMALAIIGMLIIVGGLVKFFWDKRRGGGGNTSQLAWTSIVGSLLAAPNLILPLLLGIIDLVVNMIVKLVKSVNL